MWICRFSRTTVPGMFRPPIAQLCARGTSAPMRCALAPTRYVSAHSSVLGELDRDAGSAEQTGAVISTICCSDSLGIARCAGDRAQDFGAGGLVIAGGA